MIRLFSPLVLVVMLYGLLLPDLAGAAGTSDRAKEKRWAEQIVDSLLDGEELWMSDAGGEEFLGIMTEADDPTATAVILMHGIGVHPNWPDVIYPLRIGLYEAGISNLSIQMPILPNEAEGIEYLPLFAEVPGRIDAAIDALSDAGYQRIVLVAHSLGAAMTVYYLDQTGADRVDSVALIGMSPGLEGKQVNIRRMASAKVPVFDLYGSEDLEAVVATAPERARVGAESIGVYRQQQVEGANHFFQGHETALVKAVLDWLSETGGN